MKARDGSLRDLSMSHATTASPKLFFKTPWRVGNAVVGRRNAGWAISTSLWVHMNLIWQLSRDRNLHGLDMSHATTASPKPSFRASWRVGDAVVGRRNAGWTTSKRGHPCRRQNSSLGPPEEKKNWKRIPVESSLISRDNPIGQGTELN